MWAGHTASMEEKRHAYRGFCGKTKRKEQLGRQRRRWKYNIKIYLREIVWGMDWVHLAQGREKWRDLVTTIMNIRVPYNVGNFDWATASFSTELVYSSNFNGQGWIRHIWDLIYAQFCRYPKQLT
jgi:hypothetical protein